MRIWKISAGKQSRHWRRFVAEDVAAFGAWDEGSFRNYKTRDDLFKKLKSYSLKKWGKSTTSHVEAWDFYEEVNIGDLMVLYRKGGVVAIGVVTGDYEYDESKVWDGEKYFHVRSVKWKLLDPSNRKISNDLKKNLSVPPDTVHEMKDRKDITEILRLVLF